MHIDRLAVALAPLAIACSTVTMTSSDGSADAGTAPDANSMRFPSDIDADSIDARPETCVHEMFREACDGCCSQMFPEGADFATRANNACACRADKCGTDCAGTFCASPQLPLDATCARCLAASSQECAAAAQSECEKNSGCVLMLQCRTDAGCAAKPVNMK